MATHGANGTGATLTLSKGMTGDKSLPPAALWEAFRLAIFTRGAVKVAEDTGLAEKDLYRWSTDPMNLSGEARRPLADAIIPITRATGRLDILEYLAAQVGCIVVPRPVAECVPSTLLATVAALTTEFAEVQRVCAASLSDSMMTLAEGRAIETQITELQMRAESLRLTVRHAIRLPVNERRGGSKAGAR